MWYLESIFPRNGDRQAAAKECVLGGGGGFGNVLVIHKTHTHKKNYVKLKTKQVRV